jgi:non-ribosomal peptide synthetase component E (peptide arylation enzyme)
MNLAHVLKDGLAQSPDKVLFEGDGRQFTYAQVAQLSENFGASLATLGYLRDLADWGRTCLDQSPTD